MNDFTAILWLVLFAIAIVALVIGYQRRRKPPP